MPGRSPSGHRRVRPWAPGARGVDSGGNTERMRQLTSLDAQFLHVETPTTVGHVGQPDHARPVHGPRWRVERRDRARRARATPAPRGPAAAAPRRGAAGARPPLLGRRPALRHRVPPARARPPGAGQSGAARRAGGPHPRPPARPLAAAVGGLRHHRAGRRPRGLLLEDPPRRDRRRLRLRDPRDGHGPRSRASRGRPRAGAVRAATRPLDGRPGAARARLGRGEPAGGDAHRPAVAALPRPAARRGQRAGGPAGQRGGRPGGPRCSGSTRPRWTPRS